MSGENRSWAPCKMCIRLGDERYKEIHGYGLCSKHHRAYLRAKEKMNTGDTGIIHDRHITQETKAHEFVAEKFQKFLHVLNHEKVTLVVPEEDIQEVRLLVNPLAVRSERIAVPRALPADMLIDPQGDMSPEDSEETVPSAPLGALAMAREARKRELKENLAYQREQHALALLVITTGFDELSTRDRYKDGDAFKRLTLAVQLLRSLLGQPKTLTEAEQRSEEVEDENVQGE